MEGWNPIPISNRPQVVIEDFEVLDGDLKAAMMQVRLSPVSTIVPMRLVDMLKE